MLIKVGGSPENPGAIILVPSFRPDVTEQISDSVTRCVDNRGNIPEIRYETSGGKSYISGYTVSETSFHISRIVNNERKGRQFRNLLTVFHTTIDHLATNGIKEITVNCKPQLVPIAVKRYGFQPTDKSTLEDVMKKSGGVLLVPLVKRLS